jgi:hypothetical protein
MFHGTTIDELVNIVERAEEHARTPETVEVTSAQVQVMPGFLYEMKNRQSWYGVA